MRLTTTDLVAALEADWPCTGWSSSVILDLQYASQGTQMRSVGQALAWSAGAMTLVQVAFRSSDFMEGWRIHWLDNDAVSSEGRYFHR